MKRLMTLVAVCAIAGALSARLVHGQPANSQDSSAGTLIVSGHVPQPLRLSLSDLRSLPRTTATAQERGRTMTYEGVLVAEVLKKAGVGDGHGHGSSLAGFVVATARDGYQVVFSMGELDPALGDSQVMVADTLDAKPLPDGTGPLRIVAPKDGHGSRGVRTLERLELMSVKH